MRTLITLLTFLLIYGLSFGQQKEIDKDSLFFPNNSFDCKENYDLDGNNYWSNYLIMHKKTSIYKDSALAESFRLMYWGEYFSIVEIIKSNNVYQIIIDSLSWRDHIIHRQIGKIYNLDSIFKIHKLCEKLWKKRSYGKCFEDNPMAIDDRDSWVLEFKINHEYKIIERTEVDNEIKAIIFELMKLGGLTGFGLYNDSGEFKKY